MKREGEIARVTLIGCVVNLLLMCLKAVAGVAGHSAAMISDAVHSLSDFVTDIIVLVFVRVSGTLWPSVTYYRPYGALEITYIVFRDLCCLTGVDSIENG